LKNKNRIISIVGPESTGKTTLTAQLAAHFGGVVVPEFAREYLDKRKGKYKKADLLTIAKQQTELERKAIATENSPIFCDTDMLVILVWHRFKYKEPSSELEKLFLSQPKRKYLLMYPDIPWQPDPLRENPNDLIKIFNMYERALKATRNEYKIIKETGVQRTSNAIKIVETLIS